MRSLLDVVVVATRSIVFICLLCVHYEKASLLFSFVSAGECLMLAVSFVSFSVLFSFVSFSMVTISMAFDFSNLAYVLCLISSGVKFVL